MSIIKTIAFGRMWRYECDALNCPETATLPVDYTPPPMWTVQGDKILCPLCKEGKPVNVKPPSVEAPSRSVFAEKLKALAERRKQT